MGKAYFHRTVENATVLIWIITELDLSCTYEQFRYTGPVLVLTVGISKNYFYFLIFHPRKISSLMTELQALKQEKGDTEEARKMAEEEIEKMKKDHEEKVFSFVS